MGRVLVEKDRSSLIDFFQKNNLSYNEKLLIDRLKNSHFYGEFLENEISSLVVVSEINEGHKILFKNSDNLILEKSLGYFKEFDKKLYLMDIDKRMRDFYLDNGFIEKEQIVKYELMPYETTIDILLEKAEEKDLSEIIEVDRLAFGEFWKQGEKSLLYAINYDKGLFLTYKLEDKIIAYISFTDTHINRLAVLPKHHGKGIGKQIMKKAINILWEKGVKTLTLNTQISNDQSRPLYESLGFVEKGTSYVLEKI